MKYKCDAESDKVTIYMCFGFEGNRTYKELVNSGYCIDLDPVMEFIGESASCYFGIRSAIYSDDYQRLCFGWYGSRILSQKIINNCFLIEKEDEIEPVTD